MSRAVVEDDRGSACSSGSAASLLSGDTDRQLLSRIALLADILEKVDEDLTLAEVLRLTWVRKRTRLLDWAPTPSNVIQLKHEMQSHMLTERVRTYLERAMLHWQDCVLQPADLEDIDEGGTESFEAEPGQFVTYTSKATGRQYEAKVITKHPGLSPEDS
jgi:hypothetical protein